jgi:hypothetical protein
MASSFGDTYDTGTISIANGSIHATFVDTLLGPQAELGDLVLLDNLLLYVANVIDDTHIDFASAWTGTSVVDGEYLLMKVSKSRYDPAITQQKQREVLAFFEASGVFLFVAGAAPDPGLGVEGQWALKANTGDWQVWFYTGGSWVEQGSPTGIDLQGTWSAIITYTQSQTVSWQGKLWRSKVDSNLNHQPDSSPTQWLQILSGGDQYDIQFFDTDRPASGELVDKLYPSGVTFYVGLTTSRANAEVASTGTVFFSFQKNNVEFARLTFNAGNSVGVFSCPVQTIFGATDKYTMIAPASRDVTLSGVGGNLVGYR